MGQVHSTVDPHSCTGETSSPPGATGRYSGHGSGLTSRQTVLRNKNLVGSKRKETKNLSGGNDERNNKQLDHQQHVRKLSNVSNRNIQLLSMRPRSDRDAYADGLRSRRRSSLINLILGAPSSGPKFSDDLCSLSSHMSELCDFGIDYFPDSTAVPHYAKNTSVAASLTRLEEGERTSCCVGGNYLKSVSASYSVEPQQRQHVNVSDGADRKGKLSCGSCHQQHRRRSSLGSMSSFESANTQTVARSDEPRANPFSHISYDPASQMRADANQANTASHNEDNDGRGEVFATRLPASEERDRQRCDGFRLAQNNNRLHLNHGGNEEDWSSGQRQFYRRRPSLSSIFFASIDLTSSLDESDISKQPRSSINQDSCGTSIGARAPQLVKSGPTLFGGGSSDSGSSHDSTSSRAASSRAASSQRMTNPTNLFAIKMAVDNSNGTGGPVAAAPQTVAKERINQTGVRRMLHRSGSELSLYSSASTSSCNLSYHQLFHYQHHPNYRNQHQHQNLSAYHSSPLYDRSRNMYRDSIGTNVFEQGCCGGGGGGGSLDWAKGPLPHRLSTTAPARNDHRTTALVSETKLIIMLQVCLPFILAGFGNMAAGLVLNQIAKWEAFRNIPIFFVLLPSFVGLKGNIEMTLASRLSTLANLHLLETSYQRRHAFVSNLILILSQAIGLSMFAALASILCGYLTGKLDYLELAEISKLSMLVVLPCALITSVALVIVSSIMMWYAIWFANLIQVNPDNLSTLIAAMYGDVSCVLTYGLFAELMYSWHLRGNLVWPILIICSAIISWPPLWYAAFKFRETHDLSLSSMPPMLTGIVVSLGSGTVLSLVVGRFSRIALYQPVVNGFGANLIAVQASRVSTWLWCGALRRLSSSPTRDLEPSSQNKLSKLGASLVSFTETATVHGFDGSERSQSRGKLSFGVVHIPKFVLKSMKTLLWSFLNPSPNSVAARLLLIMLVPAHTLYFFVIWLLSPTNYVVVTWQFYLVYIGLCLTQVFILLAICEPLMTFLMRRHLDPDIFGISLLMALADLVGTLCLTGAFMFLASIGDPNAAS